MDRDFNSRDEAIDLVGYHLTNDQNDLEKWTFPSAILQAGEYLVVFASGQLTDDYVDGSGNLHTNFQLSSDGEYLGLIEPDGSTIATEIAPEFPSQRSDFSCGVGQQITFTTLVDEGAVGHVLIPTASDATAIGSSWTGDSPNEPEGRMFVVKLQPFLFPNSLYSQKSTWKSLNCDPQCKIRMNSERCR